MTPHNMCRQTKHFSQSSHFIFEQVAKWFDQFETEIRRQTSNIVMQFNVRRSTRVTVATLDHIRIERPLCKEFHIAVDGFRRLAKNINEAMTDETALFLRIRNPI